MFYHGHIEKEFWVNPYQNSRYGFPCIFFTDNIELAQCYGSTIISASIPIQKKIDFGNKISHSLEFRNLIYKLKNEKCNSVAIENVYDRPNDDHLLHKATIVVVFNLEILRNKNLCTIT
jgi:hypothetical protein